MVNKLAVIVDAVSATTTDHIQSTGGYLYLGRTAALKAPICPTSSYVKGSLKKTIAVGATAQVSTQLFAGTSNSVLYGVTVSQLNRANNTWFIKTYWYQTPSSGTITAAATAQAFKDMYDADAQFKVSVSISTATLTLTADTGYEIFTQVNVPASIAAGSVTLATTTAGVYSKGQTPYYPFQNWDISTPSNYAGSTAGYTYYQFTINHPSAPVNSLPQAYGMDVLFAINTDDADAAALVTAADAVFAAL